MKLERAQNINTKDYWDERYKTIVNEAPPIASLNNFFKFGFLPMGGSTTVLDIGCGTATHYPEVYRKHPWVKFTGADISEFATAHNKERYSDFADFLRLDIEKQNIPKTYDYIISAHTFEHLNDPVAALAKCRARAKKGVIICVPFKESWSYDHEHMHTFSETEPFTDHDYYLVEYHMAPHNVGAIYFRFKGQQ